MHIKYESQLREPLVYGEKNFHQVTEDILRPIEVKPSRLWYIGFFIAVINDKLACFFIFLSVFKRTDQQYVARLTPKEYFPSSSPTSILQLSSHAASY